MIKEITVNLSYEMISKSLIKICDERIARLQIAIPLCKHTKRKYKAKKMLAILEHIRDRQMKLMNGEQPTNLEDSE